MRILLFFSLTSLLFSCVQQNFEGTIRYLRTNNKKDSSYYVSYFGKTKMKVDIYDRKERDFLTETILTDFEKGLSFTINHRQETYTIDTLPVKAEVPSRQSIVAGNDTAVILGHRTRRTTITDTTFGFEVISHIRTAVDLHYTIPEKFRQPGYNGVFSDNNYCWLEMQSIAHIPHIIETNDGKDTIITVIRAIEIIPGSVDESGFKVPAWYKKVKKMPRPRIEAIVKEQTPDIIPPPPPPPPPKKLKPKN